MKKGHSLVFVGLSLISILFSTVNYAGNHEGAFKLTVGAGYDYLASKRNMNNAGGPMLILGYDFTNRWGFEAMLATFNTRFKGNVQDNRGINGTLFALDGVYHFCPLFKCVVEPFVLAGAGVVGLNPNKNSANNEGNINAGVGVEVFVHRSVALRAEVRDFYTLVGGKNDIYLDAGITVLLPC